MGRPVYSSFHAGGVPLVAAGNSGRSTPAREEKRFGQAAISPGGAMHRQHCEFIAWASAYDERDESIRSHRRHTLWLEALTCPIIRLEGEMTTAEQVTIIERGLAGLGGEV